MFCSGRKHIRQKYAFKYRFVCIVINNVNPRIRADILVVANCLFEGVLGVRTCQRRPTRRGLHRFGPMPQTTSIEPTKLSNRAFKEGYFHVEFFP
jgi:hypothetical protein